jgi:hypothetical protein
MLLAARVEDGHRRLGADAVHLAPHVVVEYEITDHEEGPPRQAIDEFVPVLPHAGILSVAVLGRN